MGITFLHLVICSLRLLPSAVNASKARKDGLSREGVGSGVFGAQTSILKRVISRSPTKGSTTSPLARRASHHPACAGQRHLMPSDILTDLRKRMQWRYTWIRLSLSGKYYGYIQVTLCYRPMLQSTMPQIQLLDRLPSVHRMNAQPIKSSKILPLHAIDKASSGISRILQGMDNHLCIPHASVRNAGTFLGLLHNKRHRPP